MLLAGVMCGNASSIALSQLQHEFPTMWPLETMVSAFFGAFSTSFKNFKMVKQIAILTLRLSALAFKNLAANVPNQFFVTVLSTFDRSSRGKNLREEYLKTWFDLQVAGESKESGVWILLAEKIWRRWKSRGHVEWTLFNVVLLCSAWRCTQVCRNCAIMWKSNCCVRIMSLVPENFPVNIVVHSMHHLWQKSRTKTARQSLNTQV